MSSKGKGVVYSCKRGAPRRKVTSFTCSGAKRQKSTYVKDGITLVSAVSTSTCTDRSTSTAVMDDITIASHMTTEDEVPSASTYVDRRNKVTDDWQGIRDALQKGFVESCVPGRVCSSCGMDIVDCPITCEDCGPGTVYCQACCQQIHSIVQFHIPLIWPGETYAQLKLPRAHLMRPNHNCQTKYHRDLTVIDSRGRQHDVVVIFCECEPEPVTLVRLRLWPSSPKAPRVAFHMGLMDLQQMLFLEAQVSVQSFCKTLEHLQTELPFKKKMVDVYRGLVRDATDEYSFFKYSIDSMRSLIPDAEDGTTCPACPKTGDGIQIISVDANFGLVRKRQGGKSSAPPKKNIFFMDQSYVDEKVESLPYCTKKDVDCNDFKAGDKIRSSVKTAKLDETAVFGSMCRHEFPKIFCDIRGGGERLGYSLCILEKLQECLNGGKLIFMYDIACLLLAYIKNVKKTELLQNVSLAVPIFHSFGHRTSCQIQYNPRRIENAGFSDGECLERLWAYLRKFANTTKVMSSGRRKDALSSALQHYALKVRKAIAPSLVKRFERATQSSAANSKELEEIMKPLSTTIEEVHTWATEELNKAALQARPLKNTVAEHTWMENYAYQLHRYEIFAQSELVVGGTQSGKMKMAMNRFDKSLKKIEDEHNLMRLPVDSYTPQLESWTDKERSLKLSQLSKLSSERRFLLALIRKYADGQKVVKRILGQVHAVNKQIRDIIGSYNHLASIHVSSTNFPNSVSYGEIIDSDWPWWTKVACDMPYVSVSSRRQAIDTYCLYSRATEEVAMCRNEMHNVVAFLQQQCEKCKVAVNQILETEFNVDSPSLYARGAMCLVQQKLLKLQAELRFALLAFENVIDLPEDLLVVDDSINVDKNPSDNDEDDNSDLNSSDSQDDSDCDMYDEIDGAGENVEIDVSG